MGWITGIPIFLWKLFCLVVIFPVTVVIEVLRFIAQLIAWSPGLFALLALWLVGSALSNYGNVVISYADYVVRCGVNPVVENFIGPLLNLLRTIFNPTICVWDALNWFVFGYFNNVLVPDAVACGASEVLVSIGCVLTQFFDSFVVYIATGHFLTGFYDMKLLSAALVELINAWILCICCLCQDLCCLVKVVPFMLPLPPPLTFLIPALMTQYDFWQSIESLINLGASLLQILWPLLINLLNLTAPASRPNFAVAAGFGCQFFERINPAIEGALQRSWDTFIPWRFNFTGVLGAATSLACISVDSIEVALTVAVNVDIVVFNMFTPLPNTYIGPPYTTPIDLWRGPIEQTIIQILNTWAPTTNPAFYFDVHTIGRVTVIEGLCTLTQRIVCDWNNSDVPCFNTSPDFANQTMNGGFLAGFNWCCFLNTAITAINDWNVLVYSFWLHTTSASDWFGWLDSIGPNLLVVAGDLTAVADCVFSLVDAVPIVGYCLKQVFVQLVNFGVHLLAFILQIVIGLVTLIWDVLNNTQSRNFLIGGPAAIDEWTAIVQILMSNSSSSLLNCVRYILNYGIQIPPITLNNNSQYQPCGPPACTPVDYIPPPPIIGRYGFPLFPESGHLIDLHARYTHGSEHRKRVTPLLVYDTPAASRNDTRGHNGMFHHIGLAFAQVTGQRRSVPQLPDGDEFIAERRHSFYERYDAIQACHADELYKRELRRTDPWRFKVMTAQNKLPDTSHCHQIGAYDNIYPGKERREQRRIFMASVDSFGILDSWTPPSWWPSRLEIPPPLLPGEAEYYGLAASDVDHPGLEHASMDDFIPPPQPQSQSRIIPPPPPLTQRPTNAPVSGCPAPGAPPNPCFDLACFPTSVITLIGTVLQFAGNLADGLIRGYFPSQGEVQWGYFTGGNCPTRCLEQDVIALVTVLLDPLICTCRLLELILPSSPQFPQPDFCCALTSLADFIANSIQVIINGIQSLALDSPEFVYFNNGYFVRDIDVLFAELLEIVLCLCQFVRYVFPITQLTGGTIYGGGAFDICCIPMVLVDTGIEVTQLIVLSIINLATIEGDGIAFWQFSTEQPDLYKIGFLIQVDVVLETFFGSPGGICAAQGRPQGVGGITSCICQIFALLFPIRQNPALPVSPTNCPTVDLCCPIREGGYLAKDLLAFGITAIAGLWQSWDPAVNGHCDPGWLQPGQTCSQLPQEPYAFLDFVFCNEMTPWELANLPLSPVERQQQAKCGKALPIIAEFVAIISYCPCEFLSLADAWLALYFQGFDCFCGPVDGFFTNLGDLVAGITTSVVTLIRRINDITPNGGPNQFDETNTWTWNFLGPIIDPACNTLAALTCFLDILLPFCQQLRLRIIESIWRWGVEVIVKFGAFLEGVVGIFTQGSACQDPGQTCAPGSPHYGVTVDQLANIFTSLVSFPIDALIGDSTVVCSMLNPPQCPLGNLCCCYNTNPQAGILFIHVTTGSVFSNPLYQCAQCLDPSCSTYEESFAYRTCSINGAPQVPCFNDTINGGTGLVSCNLNNPELTKLDGVIMAILRYFQCILTQLVPAFGQVLQGLVVMVSVVWQLSNSILRLIASIIMFIFGLFVSAGGFFSTLGLVNDFLGIFTALSQVFQTGPVIPQQPTFRETRNELRARINGIVNQPDNQQTAGDLISLMLGVVFNYTTDACWNNFTDCACQNLNLDDALCSMVAASHAAGRTPPSKPVLHAVAATMTGNTFCDHHLQAMANVTTSWEDMWPSDRAYYVECMEKIIQGGRLNDVSSLVPADIFYRHEGPLHFWDNMRFSVVAGVEREHQEVMRHRQARRMLPDDVYEQRWRNRNSYIEHYVRHHPRWSKSKMSSFLIQLDQYEHKIRTGFYMPLVKQALRNIQRQELPRISVRERFAMLSSHLSSIGGNIWSLQVREAASQVYEGLTALPEALEMLRTRSWWSIYWHAVTKAHAQPTQAKARAAGERRREIVREGIRSSPVYQWWYRNKTTAAAGPARENPLSRLVMHLQRVFAWQRAQWDDPSTPATLVNADLVMRANFGSWLERRTALEWTPEILANWAAAGRMWHRAKERIWPGSTAHATVKRFNIGPFCNISWSKRAVDTTVAEGIGLNCSANYFGLRERQEQMQLEMQEERERNQGERGFLIDGNCLLLDGFIDEAVFLTTYCTVDYIPQLPPFQRRALITDKSGWATLLSLAAVHNKYHSDMETWPNPRPHEDEKHWTGWGSWLARRSKAWVRPKMPWPSGPRASDWRRTINRQQWLRSTVAATFDFATWFLNLLDSIFGTAFVMDITNFINDVEAWFLNTNEDWCLGVKTGKGVGFAYWAKFPVRCEFQPRNGTLACNAANNLNCKIGIGLEAAIGWVTFYMVVVYIGLAILIPPLTGVYTVIPTILLWLILVPAVAWHYSPRCWLMTPAAIIPGAGSVGITVPYWPFPIAFPALPFCLMDDLTALVVKYTTFCWCQLWWGTSLQFICPPYAVLGNPCPPCPELISIVNCKSIGMGGGIDNFIWLGMQWFPNFGTWVLAFAQIVFLSGHLGQTLADIGNYLVQAVNNFRPPLSPDQSDLFWWCFGLTSFSMAGPILFFVLAFLILGLAWALFVLGIVAVWGVVYASPFLWLFPGAASGSAYESLGGTTPAPNDDDAPYVAVQSQITLDGRRRYLPVQRHIGQRSVLFAALDELYTNIWNRLMHEYHR